MSDASLDTAIVTSACEPADLAESLAALRARVASATPQNPLCIDLTAGRPTAFALQLAASAALSLTRRSAFGGYGPNAAACLSRTDH